VYSPTDHPKWSSQYFQSSGFKRFQLELHIPYFVLRPKTSTETINKLAQTKQHCIDISFLRYQPDHPPDTHDVVIQTQCSIVISGVDNNHWIGYAFGDPLATDAYNAEDVSDEDEDEDEGEVPYDQDLFATGGSSTDGDITHHIWDARTYFLQTAAVRVRSVSMEYSYLVQSIEPAIKHWVSDLNSAQRHTLTERAVRCVNTSMRFANRISASNPDSTKMCQILST
jgi:hypothetical protein